MNEREALELCRDLWGYLKDNEGHDKFDAFRFLGLEPADYLNQCPLCEYTRKRFFPACEECPLKDFWLGFADEDFEDDNLYCCTDNSPYNIWEDTYSTEHAKLIYEASVKALEELDSAN